MQASERTVCAPLLEGIMLSYQGWTECPFGFRRSPLARISTEVMGLVNRRWLMGLLVVACLTTQSAGQERVSLPAVAAGTVVGDSAATRWNRVLLLAKPRIASGDTHMLGEWISGAVGRFTLCILATVARDAKETTGYRLQEVGVAYATDINQQLMTITVDSAESLGVKLDFLGRNMLSENENQLSRVRRVVQTNTLTMFDVPAILLRREEHRPLTMRHLIWVDGRSGKLGMAVWLLDRDSTGRLAAVDPSFRVISEGTREDRRVHVAGSEFNFLGIPKEKAFALESMPPGKDIPWGAATKGMAAEQNYSNESLTSFSQLLNQEIAASVTTSTK